MTADTPTIVITIVVTIGGWFGLPRLIRAIGSRERALGQLGEYSRPFALFYATVSRTYSFPGIGVARYAEGACAVVVFLTSIAMMLLVPQFFTYVALPISLMTIALMLVQADAYSYFEPSGTRDPSSVPMLPPRWGHRWLQHDDLERIREYVGLARSVQYSAFILFMLSGIYLLSSTGPIAGDRGWEVGALALALFCLPLSTYLAQAARIVTQDQLFRANRPISSDPIRVEIHSNPPVAEIMNATGTVISIGGSLRIRRYDDSVVDFKWADIQRVVSLGSGDE